MRKVLPFIQPDYFTGIHQKLFKELASFVAKYNKLPTEEAFRVEVDQSDRFSNANDYTEASAIIPDIFKVEPVDEKWLENTTEKWCQDQAVHKAVLEAITVIDGKHKTLSKNSLPDLLQKALAVSFDTNIGHDYIEAFSDRYDFYHKDEERIEFDIEKLNANDKSPLFELTEITELSLKQEGVFEQFDIIVPVYHKTRPLAFVLIGDLFDEAAIILSLIHI